LAARNCWIDRNLKISCFGLCRKAENGHCSLTSDDKQIPAKWTAPEVIILNTALHTVGPSDCPTE